MMDIPNTINANADDHSVEEKEDQGAEGYEEDAGDCL